MLLDNSWPSDKREMPSGSSGVTSRRPDRFHRSHVSISQFKSVAPRLCSVERLPVAGTFLALPTLFRHKARSQHHSLTPLFKPPLTLSSCSLSHTGTVKRGEFPSTDGNLASSTGRGRQPPSSVMTMKTECTAVLPQEKQVC